MQRSRLVLLLLLILVVALALTLTLNTQRPVAQAPTSPQAPIDGAASPVTPTRTGPTPTPTLGPGMYVNPVLRIDFPDPDLLQVGDTYYAYATNAGPTNIQVARSRDLVTWEPLTGALPALPGWAKPQAGLTWAPEVTTSADGRTFLMYYTTRDSQSDRQCIGVATSAQPEGPFLSPQPQPLICQANEGGSIDAASFVDDDGSRYLLWKNDGNCCSMDTWLYIQPVSADGLSLLGQPTRLIKNDKAWEGSVIEAPTLWKHNGRYYLFYSANWYKGENYAVGYATADKILGPYTKADRPLLTTDLQTGAAFGPGGQDIVRDKEGETWLVYHSWDPTLSLRWMQLDELVFEGDRPVVKGPTKSPQPVP